MHQTSAPTRSLFALLIAAALAGCVPAGETASRSTKSVASGCEIPTGSDRAERELLDWMNGQRKARGLAPFRRSAHLDRAAVAHACDMEVRGYFEHSRPGGPKLGDRVKGAGYPMYRAAENLAWTRSLDASGPAGIWRKSPSHWPTVLDPDLTEIGLAVSGVEGGRVYWVMDVAAPRWW